MQMIIIRAHLRAIQEPGKKKRRKPAEGTMDQGSLKRSTVDRTSLSDCAFGQPENVI